MALTEMFSATDEGVDKLKRDDKVQTWLNELADADKREKDFRKEAGEAIEIFEAEESAAAAGVHSFNILYANTETLSPAVYNNTPRPVVKRKIGKQNPVAMAAAEVLQKVLECQVDSADREVATYDDLMKDAVAEALVPGRGLCRFDYDADITETTQVEGQPPVPAQVNSETIAGNAVPWNRVRFGYAKQWHLVPWCAFEHFMTKAELEKTFGEEKAAKIKLTHSKSEDREDTDKTPANADGVKFAHVWEIWDKGSKKVIFLSEGFDTFIQEDDDPLQLNGFFPIPRPLIFLRRIKSLVPKTLYKMYEQQAIELDDVSTRIIKITRALKVRGFYDGTLAGLDELLKKPDNTLMAAEAVAALQQGQSLDKAIWLFPLEKLILVLQQLYANRQQIQSVIHQITGIADIMRGDSAASETLGAQKMKESWGTMRLKRMQKEVQRFTKETFRIQAEIAANHFQIDTFIAMTGLQLPRQQEKEMAQQAVQQFQAQQALQPPPQPGQPPQQPQVPPQIAQAQQLLSKPSWEEVVQFLRDDKIRNYVIDIETNSTVDIEATEDKQELAEFMNAISQLMNGALPMVEKGILPFDAAKALMLSVVQKFRLGQDVEQTFMAIQEPKPKEDPKAQADKQKAEAEMAQSKQKFEMEMAAQQQELAQKREIAQLELQVQREDLEMQRQEMALKREFMTAKHQADMAMLVAKATMPPAAAPKPEGASNAAV
jgi:hypothetical protein